MDETIQEIEEETKEEDYAEGCFVENYMVPHVCPIATGGWCRDYIKCKGKEGKGINPLLDHLF